MTPKEKAKELFDKYFDLYPDQDAYFLTQLAAIMAVEENSINLYTDTFY